MANNSVESVSETKKIVKHQNVDEVEVDREETKSSHRKSVVQFNLDMNSMDDLDFECDVLKYPNKFMRVFGLYHTKQDNIVFKIYALALCVIDWTNFFRLFTVYKSSESLSAELVLKMVTHIWFFICAFLATIIFINQEVNSRQPHLMKNLTWVMSSKEAVCNKKRLRVIIYTIYSVTFVFAAINFSATVISFFGPKVLFSGFRLFLAPFHNSEWAAGSVPFKLAILFLTGVTSFHWCLTTAVYLVHCIILIEFMRVFNVEFKSFVKKSILVSSDNDMLGRTIACNFDENIFIEATEKMCVCDRKFEKYRILHLKLSYNVQLLDKCYREFIGINVIFYTIIVLLLVYVMSDWQGNCVNGIMVGLYPFWTVVSGSFLLLVVIFAALIHSLVFLKDKFTKIIKYLDFYLFFLTRHMHQSNICFI